MKTYETWELHQDDVVVRYEDYNKQVYKVIALRDAKIKLEAENARYREALRKIITETENRKRNWDESLGDINEIAKKALEAV